MERSGEQFGQYQLLERIAVGGMAEIFRARARGASGFERIVAIKRLHRHLSEDRELVQMLIDEARLVVQLNHPNIAAVFDLGCLSGQYFIVMEYIDGLDMHQVLRRLEERRAPIGEPIAVYLLIEMLSGLQYAHDMVGADGHPLQIVHRDISPQNVMCSRAGEVKLVDFGIAKARMQALETQAGIIKGKFFYMSPEQARGHSLDRRSDVFAAGMVAYELLAGRPAYDEAGDVQLLKRVRACDFSPPSRWRPEIDGELESIVMRALALEPGDRYESARAFQLELIGWTRRQPMRQRMKHDAAEFVRAMVDGGAPAEALGQAAMNRGDFRAGDDSMLIESPLLGHHAPPPARPRASGRGAKVRVRPPLRAPIGENPFAAPSEPTFVLERGDDNPFAIPDVPSAPERAARGEAFGGRTESLEIDRASTPPPPVASIPVRVGQPSVPPSWGAPPPGVEPASIARLAREPTLITKLNELFEPENRGRLIAIVAAFALATGVMIWALVDGRQIAPAPAGALPAARPEAGAPRPAAAALAKAARLEIDSIPPVAEVLIDGERLGHSTPSVVRSLKIGMSPTIEIRKRGYEPWREKIEIDEEIESITAELEREASPGTLIINAKPSDALVRVNGEKLADQNPHVYEVRDRSEELTIEISKGSESEVKIVSFPEGEEVHKVSVAVEVKKPRRRRDRRRDRTRGQRFVGERGTSKAPPVRAPDRTSSQEPLSGGDISVWE